AEDGIRDFHVTGVQTCALPIYRLGAEFEKALQLVMECQGKVIFTGIGKSGHIGRKLSATFASTGTPAFFVHADEALHGDSGMVRSEERRVGQEGGAGRGRLQEQ